MKCVVVCSTAGRNRRRGARASRPSARAVPPVSGRAGREEPPVASRRRRRRARRRGAGRPSRGSPAASPPRPLRPAAALSPQDRVRAQARTPTASAVPSSSAGAGHDAPAPGGLRRRAGMPRQSSGGPRTTVGSGDLAEGSQVLMPVSPSGAVMTASPHHRGPPERRSGRLAARTPGRGHGRKRRGAGRRPAGRRARKSGVLFSPGTFRPEARAPPRGDLPGTGRESGVTLGPATAPWQRRGRRTDPATAGEGDAPRAGRVAPGRPRGPARPQSRGPTGCGRGWTPGCGEGHQPRAATDSKSSRYV